MSATGRNIEIELRETLEETPLPPRLQATEDVLH